MTLRSSTEIEGAVLNSDRATSTKRAVRSGLSSGAPSKYCHGGETFEQINWVGRKMPSAKKFYRDLAIAGGRVEQRECELPLLRTTRRVVMGVTPLAGAQS